MQQPPMWSSVGPYVRAVARHWLLVVIGLIGLAGDFVTIFADVIIPEWTWYVVTAVGFVLAQFRAYHDVRIGKLAAAREVAELRLALDERQARRSLRDRLGVLFEEGRALLQRAFREDTSLTEDELDEWATRVRDEVLEGMGATDAALLGSGAGLSLPLTTSVQNEPYGKWHRITLVWVTRLEQFIQRLDG